MECTYKGMQCKYIARLLFVNSATQAKAMPIRPKAMPIRPKAMPGREIQESQTAWKQHCMCCNPQMTWWVSFYCFHYLSLGSSLMMYKDMQGCTKICNAHNQIIGCRKKHCTKTNACQRILSLQKTYVEVCHKHMEHHQTFLCTCSVHKSIVLNVFELLEQYCFFGYVKSWGEEETGRAPAARDEGCQWPDHEPWLRASTPCIFGITINLNLSISVTLGTAM